MGSSLTQKAAFPANAIVTALVLSLWSPDLSSGILSQRYGRYDQPALKSCDPALPLQAGEREDLLDRLQDSATGRGLLEEFKAVYGDLDSLIIQWDTVSYSQISKERGRVPAHELGTRRASVVCVHLAKKLPDIEHLADLAHEIVHANRLPEKALKGDGMAAEEFVHARIASRGGEAEAFAEECAVKRDVLGRWDAFCAPYVVGDDHVEQARVVEDLYSGALSASLTGEPYPVMLAKQYRRMNLRRRMNGVLK